MGLSIKIPRLLGEVNNKDTQFTAVIKQYQELILVGGVIAILVFLFFGISAYMGGAKTGTWRYGLCKIFLEQYTFYPDSLIILAAQEKRSGVVIRYMITSPYGGQESEEMECFYNVTASGIELSRVTIDRKSLSLLETVQGRPPKVDPNQEIPKPNYEDIMGLYDTPDMETMTRTVSQIHVDEFNKAIPGLLATGELSMKLPMKMATDIEDLKYND